ncbi:MAG: hypothetical protein IK025_03255 [Bacteroidales bacterium]|nr:hypothetical protein [Bacteroidales bacterium]
MANESSLYNIGFEEAIGEESSGNEMYRNIHVYLNKDYSEHFVLPFYFLMGHHDYLWSADGERLLFSACTGFFEYEVGLLPEKYSKWIPLIVVADIASKQILRVYEGKGTLCWNSEETDICSKDGLKEYSYDEWSKNYEARREEVEKLVEEYETEYKRGLFSRHYTPGSRRVLGDAIDEVVEEKVSSQFPEEKIGSEEYEEKLTAAKRKPYIIVIVIGLVIMLLLWLAKGF